MPTTRMVPSGNSTSAITAPRGSKAAYEGGSASSAGAPLNAAHSHFILVDSGEEGGRAFGSEIDARVALEDYLAETKRVPLVQLVVQGGPGTLKLLAAISSR